MDLRLRVRPCTIECIIKDRRRRRNRLGVASHTYYAITIRIKLGQRHFVRLFCSYGKISTMTAIGTLPI